MSEQLWEVVGGATTGGILVRVGRSLESAEAGQRLECGAVVKQTELKGERLCYELVRGSGPPTGWISLKLKGKDLVVPKAEAKRLLLLSIPWKGHIVHLRRIAEWFEGRSGYEVHFAVMPKSRQMVPPGAIAHVSEGEENSEGLWERMEDSFRDLAKSGASHGDGIGNMMGTQIRTCADYSAKGQEPFAQYFKFCLRLIREIKPHVVVGDAACTFYNLCAGLCQVQGIKYIWVQSPGLREVQAEKAAEKLGAVDASDENAVGPLTALTINMGCDLATFAKAMGVPLATLESMDQGKPTPMDPGVQLTFIGLLQTMQMNPEVAPFLCKPLSKFLGLDFKTTLQMMKESYQLRQGLSFFPSAKALVGQEPRPGDIYTGSFLPLPERDGDKLQWDQATFEAQASSVAPELKEWLYSTEDKDPIVYIAFGTIVRPNKELVELLLKTFDGGPFRVLWALPDEALQKDLPADLAPGRWRVMSFVPQADVLKCERVRAFVSHMGANSTTESLACGVPMVCCPFYMDQYEWSDVVCKYWKAGVEVDKSGSPENFRESVRRVVEEQTFAEGAAQASAAMHASSEASLRRLAQLGEKLEPPSTLGVGVSVAAATILRCMEDQPLDPIFDLISSVAHDVPGPKASKA